MNESSVRTHQTLVRECVCVTTHQEVDVIILKYVRPKTTCIHCNILQYTAIHCNTEYFCNRMCMHHHSPRSGCHHTHIY